MNEIGSDEQFGVVLCQKLDAAPSAPRDAGWRGRPRTGASFRRTRSSPPDASYLLLKGRSPMCSPLEWPGGEGASYALGLGRRICAHPVPGSEFGVTRDAQTPDRSQGDLRKLRQPSHLSRNSRDFVDSGAREDQAGR